MCNYFKNVERSIDEQLNVISYITSSKTKAQLINRVRPLIYSIKRNFSDIDFNEELLNLEDFLQYKTKFGKSTIHNIIVTIRQENEASL